jgi:hypothetical protein
VLLVFKLPITDSERQSLSALVDSGVFVSCTS